MLIDTNGRQLNQTPAPGSAFKVTNIGAGQSRSELSRQWIARPHDQRFLKLSDLYAAVKGRADSAKETRIENRKLEFITPDITDAGSMQELRVGLPNGEDFAMSHWAFGQLCNLTKSPAGFMRELPSQLVADILSTRMLRREREEVKAYSTDKELLAMTGPDYGRIYDHEVVKAVMDFTDNGQGTWKIPGVMDWSTMIYDPHHPVTPQTTTLFASDRDVFIFLVDGLHPIQVGLTKDGEPDMMFRGFYMKNSEVGSSALTLAAFYLRGICCNRIMWGVEGFEEITIRHTRFAPERFLETARPALKSFAEGSSEKLIEGVQKAKQARLAKNDDEAIDFLQARKFSKSKAAEIIEASEREEGRKPRTAWDFAQAITAVARNVPYTDERLTMELEAKKILDKVAA